MRSPRSSAIATAWSAASAAPWPSCRPLGAALIVVITTIAVENGYISSADAAAMVAAGMLSVIILPAVSIALLGRVREVRPIEPGAGL